MIVLNMGAYSVVDISQNLTTELSNVKIPILQRNGPKRILTVAVDALI